MSLKKVDTEKILYFAFLSVFLHFAVTAVTIIGIGVYVLSTTQIRKNIFAKKSHMFLLAFCGFTVIVGLLYGNFIGVICSLAFYLIMLVFYWARSVITRDMFENSLNICCAAVIPLSLAVVVEKLIHIDNSKYRCTLWFFNANYMTAIFAAVALFCVYKILETNGKKMPYHIALLASVLAMYISGSLFAFIELFVGVCMLLILRKKYTFLAGFCFLAFVALLLLYFIPELFPRVLVASNQADKRIVIWETSIDFIKERPIFGQGFLTFYHNALKNSAIYSTTHAHNLVLEMLLSFGIVGTVMAGFLLWKYFKVLIMCKENLKEEKTTSLILSLCSAMLIHATTDMTPMWIQTGLLYALILAAVAIGEKELNNTSLEENGEI